MKDSAPLGWLVGYIDVTFTLGRQYFLGSEVVHALGK
jgi:hypothetical protein